jgi:hypothetical protein
MREPDVLQQRFQVQHLSGTPLESVEDVVHLLCAVQAQDYPGASWSLGQRTRGGTQAMIDAALAKGSILRTHALRPTWHFVTPADIRWILQLTAPRVHALNAYQYRLQEIDGKVMARSRKLIVRALAGGNHLTRAELAGVLLKGGVVTDAMRITHVMMWAELDGLVCSGALKGKQQTYALLDERAPLVPAKSRDEALAELVARFFTGHGPAMLKHFTWWSGLTLADAKRGLAMVRSQLSDEIVEGRPEWLGAKRRRSRRASEPMSAYLIPEYDEVLTGWRELAALDAVADMPALRSKDTFFRPLIIGGRRVGTWRRTITGKKAVLETNLAAPLNRSQMKALRTTVEKYSAFLGLPVTIV